MNEINRLRKPRTAKTPADTPSFRTRYARGFYRLTAFLALTCTAPWC